MTTQQTAALCVTCSGTIQLLGLKATESRSTAATNRNAAVVGRCVYRMFQKSRFRCFRVTLETTHCACCVQVRTRRIIAVPTKALQCTLLRSILTQSSPPTTWFCTTHVHTVTVPPCWSVCAKWCLPLRPPNQNLVSVSNAPVCVCVCAARRTNSHFFICIVNCQQHIMQFTHTSVSQSY